MIPGFGQESLVIKFPYETVKENIHILLFQVGCTNIFALDFLWVDLGKTITTVNIVPFGIFCFDPNRLPHSECLYVVRFSRRCPALEGTVILCD